MDPAGTHLAPKLRARIRNPLAKMPPLGASRPFSRNTRGDRFRPRTWSNKSTKFLKPPPSLMTPNETPPGTGTSRGWKKPPSTVLVPSRGEGRMGMRQGQNTQLTLLERMEGSELLPKLPEFPEGSEATQHPVECNVRVKPMTILPEAHSNDCEISTGTMMHDMGGTGTTWVAGLHGTMGISSPMQKRPSCSRTSTLVTSKLPSTVSKEDRRDLLSPMDCGKVSSLPSTLTSARSLMPTMHSCLPTGMPSH